MSDAIDMKEVMERLQDDRELLMELLNLYTDDFTEKRAGLNEAAQNKDFEKLRNIAHSLKGSSGNISAKKLHSIFLTLEQSAKAQDLSQVAAALQQIDAEYAELQKYIAGLKK